RESYSFRSISSIALLPFLLCPIVKCGSGHIKSYYRKECDEINSFASLDFDAERNARWQILGDAPDHRGGKKPGNSLIRAPLCPLFRPTSFSRSNEFSGPGKTFP